MASETVAQPGRKGTGDCAAALARSWVTPGLTRKRAPAATASSICSAETIVPAPTTASGTSLAIAAMAASALGRPQRHLDRVKASRNQCFRLGKAVLDARDGEHRYHRRQRHDLRRLAVAGIVRHHLLPFVPIVSLA